MTSPEKVQPLSRVCSIYDGCMLTHTGVELRGRWITRQISVCVSYISAERLTSHVNKEEKEEEEYTVHARLLAAHEHVFHVLPRPYLLLQSLYS